MRLADLSRAEVERRLRAGNLSLRMGPFVFRLQSSLASVGEGLALLYDGHELLPADHFADFQVVIAEGAGVHRWFRRQARFVFDGRAVFEPLPQKQAYPLLEWAMNWCISAYAHQFLIIHAAVVERSGKALILPAPPGSGKSTLCAALVHSGWRLLSDELTLISRTDGRVHPLCRPVSLKNESIAVIQRFAPAAVFNRVSHETAKGSVAHMKVPAEQLAGMDVPAPARWVVYPRYEAGAATLLTERSRALSVVELARNSFNFAALGRPGFDLLCDVVDGSNCFDFRYSQLNEAINTFDALASVAE